MAPASLRRDGVAASEHQVTLDTACFGLSPSLSGFDHRVDIGQGRCRVIEAPDCHLCLRGEVEDQRLKYSSPTAAEPLAGSRRVVEGAAMITLRSSHAGAQPVAYSLKELNAMSLGRRQQLCNGSIRAGRVNQGSENANMAKTLAAGKRVIYLAHKRERCHRAQLSSGNAQRIRTSYSSPDNRTFSRTGTAICSGSFTSSSSSSMPRTVRRRAGLH
jgi:hypothetical protein